jgi:hypothetical protein
MQSIEIMFDNLYQDIENLNYIIDAGKDFISSINIDPDLLNCLESSKIQINLNIGLPYSIYDAYAIGLLLDHYSKLNYINNINLGIPLSLIKEENWVKINKYLDLSSQRSRKPLRVYLPTNIQSNTMDHISNLCEQNNVHNIIMGTYMNEQNIEDMLIDAHFLSLSCKCNISIYGNFCNKNKMKVGLNSQFQPIIIQPKNVFTILKD